jgi:hypothetical protein
MQEAQRISDMINTKIPTPSQTISNCRQRQRINFLKATEKHLICRNDMNYITLLLRNHTSNKGME